MAEDLKAKVTITAEGDKAVREAKKVQKEMKNLGATGKKSGQEVDQGSNKAASGLKKTKTAASSADTSLTTLSVTTIGLGTSITGLSDAIFGFKEKVIALERSVFGLKVQTIELTRYEEDLAEAIEKGTLSAKEHKRAVEDLAFKYQNLALEEKSVKAEQESLNSEYVSFAVNTMGVVAQSILSVTVLTKAKTAATVSSRAAVTSNTAAHAGLSKSLFGAAAAMKTLMLSNPITTAALIGGTVALAGYETNVLGLRDTIEDITGMERGSLPTLSASLGLVEPNTTKASDSIVDFDQKARDFSNNIDTRYVPANEKFADSTRRVTHSMKELSKATSELKL